MPLFFNIIRNTQHKNGRAWPHQAGSIVEGTASIAWRRTWTALTQNKHFRLFDIPQQLIGGKLSLLN